MKVIIIEDETAAANNLRMLLHETFPDIEIVATIESVAEAVEWFSSGKKADMVFMDIHLADGDAFLIFDRVKVEQPIIFTTAYDQYALEAFKVNSIDYLLKPIKASDLERAVAKFEHLAGSEVRDYSERVSELARNQNRTKALLVHVKDRIIPLKPQEIAYFYTCDEKVTACTLDSRNYPVDRSLEALVSMLPESDFFRANRQFIISRNAVTDISVWFGNRLSVNLSVSIPERIIISKARVPEFKKWISGTN